MGRAERASPSEGGARVHLAGLCRRGLGSGAGRERPPAPLPGRACGRAATTGSDGLALGPWPGGAAWCANRRRPLFPGGRTGKAGQVAERGREAGRGVPLVTGEIHRFDRARWDGLRRTRKEGEVPLIGAAAGTPAAKPTVPAPAPLRRFTPHT
ncbi:hypothetical protein ACQEU5_19885 [Marinactinospora thermotolerans]|uniref:Uncharacterized protein n=1 Tax=Marinactinospora thermotolerans DSM 45154 TaxID=1122192 RepID=A0A1T4TH78_9ACTN|nr:hypothetical protein [Marinactinospora thermotolerans]SKA39754.1 hypothetical protein SAMN02745673_05004 [Marinactinospora thermotolerans DSM 45154]